MIKRLTILTLFVAIFSTRSAAHDIHISVCDVSMTNQKVEIVIKTFIDDLQEALGLVPGEEIPKNYTSADKMIESYLNEKMKISVNGKTLKLNIERLDSSRDKAVWITVEKFTMAESIENITIESNLLVDQFSDQVNMINLKNGKQKDFAQLSKKKTKHEFTFN